MANLMQRIAVACAIVALAIGCAAVPAMAQTSAGQQEISAFFSLDNSSTSGGGGSSTTETISGSYGYFLNKNLQLGISELLTDIKTSGTEAQLSFTNGFAKWHFLLPDKPQLVPWAGGYLGFMSIKAGGLSGSGNSFGPAVGVKYFLDENTSVNAEYQIINSSYSIAGQSITQTDNTLLIGFSVYFHKK